MSLALIRKTFRDTWFVLVLALAAIIVFEVGFVGAVGMQKIDIQVRKAVPMFMRGVLKAALGADIFEIVTPTGVISFSLVHPLLQMILWAFTLAYCTRVIAGEIDRGTADLLMSLPVRRMSMYLSFTIVWICCGALLCAAPLLGVWLGEHWFHFGPYDLRLLALVCANLFALYLTVGAGSLMVSAISSRRGRAIGIVAALLIASFALNFLALLWHALEHIAWMGVLQYYRPLVIIKTAAWPRDDLLVLLISGFVFWIVGLIVFARRDIRTG